MYNKEKTKLIFATKNIVEATIPDSVSEMQAFAFQGCSKLTKVAIGKKINTIPPSTFENCSQLKEIKLPDNIRWINMYSFNSCLNLTKIIIPDTVEFVGTDCFYNCNLLTIYGYKGSYIEEYATTNNIPFEIIPKDDSTTTVNKYTVKFINYDGSQVGDIQEVEEGKAAIAPTVEAREGYTFKGWDKEFSNVKSNLEVKAIYEENKQSQGDNQNQGGQTTNSGDIANSGIIAIMILGLSGTIMFKKKS